MTSSFCSIRTSSRPNHAENFNNRRRAPASGPERRTDLQNKHVRLSELKGKVVLMDFWATWCLPCRAELPKIELLHRDFKDKGLIVLGVDDEEPKDQAAFLSKFGYT